jgi:hypothetical protein
VFWGWTAKIGGTWQILGRSLVLEESNRGPVAWILMLLGIGFLSLRWRGQGRAARLAAWVLCASVVAAVMIRPFLLSAVLLEVAAVASAVVLWVPREGPPESGWRLLVLFSFAMMTILLSGWYIDTAGVTSATPGLARTATFLLLGGFLILVCVPPFHVWVSAARTAPSLESAFFVLTGVQAAGILLIMSVLQSFDWLRDSQLLDQGLKVAGVGGLGFGSLAALAHAREDMRVRYLWLADAGVGLMCLSMATTAGYASALVGLVCRSLAGVLFLSRVGTPIPLKVRGPDIVAAEGLGLLTLGGVPLTLGAWPRWLLLRAGSAELGSLFVPAMVCMGIGAFVSIMTLARRWSEIPAGVHRPALTAGRGRGLAFALASLALGIFPWLAYAPAEAIVARFTNLP